VINIKDKKYLKRFGHNLKKVRKEKEYTQEKLSYASNLSLSQIGRIERGEINPTICTINLIAATLKVKTAILFEFD